MPSVQADTSLIIAVSALITTAGNAVALVIRTLRQKDINTAASHDLSTIANKVPEVEPEDLVTPKLVPSRAGNGQASSPPDPGTLSSAG